MGHVTGIVRKPERWMLLAICALFLVPRATAEPPAPATTVSAIFASDIHFEPFWDPGKAAQLAASPVTEWSAILAAPDSPDRAQLFANLQKSCHVKGNDTSYPLLSSSLAAMRADGAGAQFMTISGDLIAHDFSCKFDTLFPHAAPSAYSSFVAKTIMFLELELHVSFPKMAIYTALGNNDSDCADYRLDPHSAFLAVTGPLIAANFAVTDAERRQVLHTYMAGGYYSVPLPAPIRDTRLIVLDNLFMSKKYRACAGSADAQPAADQIAWLRGQLETARRSHEQVWVMAHIPPGVDPYSTARKFRDVCGGEPADMFLSSDALASTLAEFGDVIRLAIFAHTHMDELRLLQPAGGGKPVAVKMVGSISPVDGNYPSFTVARINAATAELADYKVYAAANPMPGAADWREEYDFSQTYHEPAFTASSVADLVAGFSADPKAKTAASQSYLRYFSVGDRSKEISPFWPEYVCALTNRSAESYRSCVCSGGK